MEFVPHRKHTYRPLQPVTEIALLFYVYIMFVPHKKHRWASTACYGDSFTFLRVDYVRISQETLLWISMACYGDSFTFYMQMMSVCHSKHLWPLQPVTGIALLFYV
jgi:hypothetical protein